MCTVRRSACKFTLDPRSIAVCDKRACIGDDAVELGFDGLKARAGNCRVSDEIRGAEGVERWTEVGTCAVNFILQQ